ncbi:MAG: hypothetical protein ACP5II_03870 [Infirmifilum sp.]|uniref:hypothetical protein n=1 Tax=Infirmifilum sp. TaxID=2856575 RepID=UPI003D136B4F
MDRKTLSQILAILLWMPLFLAPLLTAQPSIPAKATVSARIEYGYGLVFYHIELPEPTTSLSFNVSGYTGKLVLAVAQTERQRNVLAVVDKSQVKFAFSDPARQVNITFVFDIVTSNLTTIEIRFPIPLSPFGYATNVSGTASFSTGINVNSTFGKVMGSQVSYNATLPPASYDVIRGSTSSGQVPVGKIARINRTIILEADKIVYEDTVEILQLSNYPITSLAIALPVSYVFDGAEGLLGPYPRNYWHSYNASNSTLILITLMSSVQLVGQRTVLTLRYHTNRSNMINAYMGLGFVVTDYSVKLCIRGSLTVPQEFTTGETVTGSLQCYVLKPVGPLFQADLYPRVPVSNIVFKPSTGLSLAETVIILLVLILLLATGVFAVARIRRNKVEKAKEKVLTATTVPREVSEAIYKILLRREELLITAIENLNSLRARKAGTTKIVSVIREYEKRDTALETEVSKLLGQLGDAGREITNEMVRIKEGIHQRMNEIEKIERNYRVGRLDKKEYNVRIESLETELRNLAQKFRELAEKNI